MKHHGRVDPVPVGLIIEGPLVQVQLRVPAAMQAAGVPALEATALLMVDTGAFKTIVEQSVAEALGLAPIRFEPLMGVSLQPEMRPVYRLSVSLGMQDGAGRSAEVAFETDVIGSSSPPAPRSFKHVGLLGRDFLMHFILKYVGSEGRFELSLPDASPMMGDIQRRLAAQDKRERQARKQNRR